MKIMTIQYQPRTTSRRGIATMLAIILMAILVGTVSAMTLVFAAQTKRTQAASAGAQLRQLLSAAIPFAQQELATHTLLPTLPLPRSPHRHPHPRKHADPSLHHFLPHRNPSPRNHHLARFKAIQTLTFTRSPNSSNPWTLQSLNLTASP